MTNIETLRNDANHAQWVDNPYMKKCKKFIYLKKFKTNITHGNKIPNTLAINANCQIPSVSYRPVL